MNSKMIIGSIEHCDLPELGISNLEVRVDTGAKTSSLHVDNIQNHVRDGENWVTFDIHPNVHNVEEELQCEAPVKDIRRIKSSNGSTETRVVLETRFRLGGQEWPIEITITDRSDMRYLMLFGREGMSDKLLVDPSQTFLVSKDH